MIDLLVRIRHVRDLQPAQDATIKIALGIQTADDITSPDSPVALTSYTTTANLSFPSAFTDTAISANALGRLGWMALLTTGSTKVDAHLGGSVEFGR